MFSVKSIFQRKRQQQYSTGSTLEDGNRLNIQEIVKSCDAWTTRFTKISQDLTELSRQTESEFLAMGSNLQDFYTVFAENTSRINSVIQMIEEGSDFDRFKELFGQAYQRAQNINTTLSDTIAGLSDFDSRIERILELKDSLKLVGRSIKMFSVLMRIETQRSGETQFDRVIESLETLIQQIAQNTRGITLSASDASRDINSVNKSYRKSIEKSHDRLQRNSQHIKQVILELEAAVGNVQEQCKHMEELGSQITSAIGETVAALQFHDIIRQQIEHIAEALQNIPSKIPNHDNLKESELIQFGLWLAKAVELQIAQTKNVITETTQTSQKLLEHFSKISQLAEEQAEDAGSVLEAADSSRSQVESIDTAAETLTTALSYSKELGGKVLDAISKISEEFSSVSRQVALVDANRQDLKFLTVNAVIKAAHAGEEGKVLVVLSERIAVLSNEAQKEIEDKSELINDILTSTEQFKQTLLERLDTQLASMEETYRQTNEAIQSQIKNNEAIIQASQITKQLEKNFTEVKASIRFKEVISNSLNQTISDLQKLADEIALLFPEHLKGSLAAEVDLEGFTQQYTMQSEREVHEDSISPTATLALTDKNKSATDSVSDGDIELFGDDVGPEPERTEIATDSQNDDGIELFDNTPAAEPEKPETVTESQNDDGIELFDNTPAAEPENDKIADKPAEESPQDDEFDDNIELF